MARHSLTQHPLKGSERKPLPGARAVGKAGMGYQQNEAESARALRGVRNG